MTTPKPTAWPWRRPWTYSLEDDGYIVRDADGQCLPIYNGVFIREVILPKINTFDKAREFVERIAESSDPLLCQNFRTDAIALLEEMNGDGHTQD